MPQKLVILLMLGCMFLTACTSHPSFEWSSQNGTGLPVPSQKWLVEEKSETAVYAVQVEHDVITTAYINRLLQNEWILYSQFGNKILFAQKENHTYKLLFEKTDQQDVTRITIMKLNKNLFEIVKES